MRFPSLAFHRFARLRRHFPHSDLVAFQCASLDDAAARRIARHVDTCARCSNELALIREEFELLDQTLAVEAPLANVANSDWSRLLDALQSAQTSTGRRPSPEVLAAYLGNYARSSSGGDPTALEVLQTLLGARAAAAVSAAVLDAPGHCEAAQ